MGNCLGFGPGGVIGGSCAAVFQSVCYGGYTPAGGLFPFCQSQGARGCGVLSGSSSLLTFLTGGLLLGLGVTIGFYPDNIGITNDRDITKFAEDATDLDILPLYKYMITVGVFMLASTLLYFCCVKFFSAISLILTMVFLGLTANSIGDMNQYKILPPSAIQTHQLNVPGSLDGLYIGDNPYPRIRLMLNESLTDLMENYQYSPVMMDKIQTELECCGVLNSTDWQSLGNGTVPSSCCQSGQCREGQETFPAGCLHQMELKMFRVYFWLAVCLMAALCFGLIIQLLLLVSSCFP